MSATTSKVWNRNVRCTKHLEVRQNKYAARHIFNSLLGVWKCAQTWSFVLDKLRNWYSSLLI